MYLCKVSTMNRKEKDMSEKMEYESGIIGWAEVRFGGKISVNGISFSNTGIVGIKLCELYEKGNVGEDITQPVHEPQAYLLFDNIASVDILNDALMKVREQLKRYNEEKHKNEKI